MSIEQLLSRKKYKKIFFCKNLNTMLVFAKFHLT